MKIKESTITIGLNPVRRMTCCCCGTSTMGRQWHNRDTGYGICESCVKWIAGRGTGPQEMTRLYGDEGYHYPTPSGQVRL